MSDPSKPRDDDNTEPGDAAEFQQQVRDYSRAAGRMMWASFNREGLVSAIRTLAWLVPITILIWIYAERQQAVTTPAPGMPIAIKLQINDPKSKKLATLKMPEQVITARLNGPNARVDELQAEIRRRGVNDPIILTIDPNTSVGPHSIFTDTLLSQSEFFANTGVTALNSKPESLEFIVDEYEERTVEVEAPPEASEYLVGKPVFIPSSVTIRAPHSAFPTDGKVSVYADLKSTELLGKPGFQAANNVKVAASPMKSELVQLLTPSVKATFEVRQLGAAYTIPTVPIFISMVGALQDGFKVKMSRQNLTDVEVIGPQEKIDLIKASDKPLVKPVLDIDGSERDGSTKSRPIRFELPLQGMEGVTVKSVPPMIDYQLVPVGAAGNQ